MRELFLREMQEAYCTKANDRAARKVEAEVWDAWAAGYELGVRRGAEEAVKRVNEIIKERGHGPSVNFKKLWQFITCLDM